jgi:hypothetical protein
MGTQFVVPYVNLLVMLSIIMNKVIVIPALIAILAHGDSIANKGVTNLPIKRPIATGNITLKIIE